MKQIKCLFAAIIVGFVVFTVIALPTRASVIPNDEKPKKLDNPNLVVRATTTTDLATYSSYMEVIEQRTFRSNIGSYYVVYPEGTTGITWASETVAYQGNDYNATVLIGSDFSISPLKDILVANNTIFFHDGAYTASLTGYTRFQKDNLALIGISDHVVFQLFQMSGTGLNERNTLGQSGAYFANITFDGMNAGMNGSGSNDSYYFYIQGEYIAFKNITIKNLGQDVGGTRDVPIHVLEARGPVLFENLTLDNTIPLLGYSIIQINRSNEVFFNGITLRNIKPESTKRIDNWLTVITGSSGSIPDANRKLYILGEVNLIDNNSNLTDKMLVETYAYHTVAVPSTLYRYARLAVTPRKMGEAQNPPAITIHRTLPPQAGNYVVFDLADCSYVVNPGGTLTGQMMAIINVLSRIRSVKGITSKEEFNIKYGLPTVTPLAIHLLNITTTIAGLEDYDDNIYLNVILVSDIANSIVSPTPELVKFDIVGGDTIVMGSETPERYKVYNVDFDTISKLTLQEVVTGVSAVGEFDPYAISLYPSSVDLHYSEYFNSKPAVAENAFETTFVNSKFTSLVNEIEITTSHSGPMTVGQTIQLNAGLANSNTNSFTSIASLNSAIMSNTANDTSILWFSTDTSIVMVDATGMVTAIAPGTATIVAKALDTNNEGEVEKPWAIFPIAVSKTTIPITAHHEVRTGVGNYILLSIIMVLMGVFLVSMSVEQKKETKQD